ncbi:transitional endoplasmic reticulum ATPase [Galendromus occidentalis]|uniref:vesicle-fusing ATPase n=1 Tax=Galendromus occidentalis TaxID=34638 RepID=A0AAJ6QYH5_9ACAR|nr:transitional endoplasmic reticulum ATPase [Galendromus occidentalis]
MAAEESRERPLTSVPLSDETKPVPKRLIVDEAVSGDDSCVYLAPTKIRELDLPHGGIVLLQGPKRRKTVARLLTDESCLDEKIRVSESVRNNLRTRIGGEITIQICGDIINGKSIRVLPIEDTVEGFNGSLLYEFLYPYFHYPYDHAKPIHAQDTFTVRGRKRSVAFRVIRTDPTDYCIVDADTTILCAGAPIKRGEEIVGYSDIGGCRKQLALIKEMVELPLRRPTLLKSFGVKSWWNILLQGPPGVGKTRIARAIVHQTAVYSISINGREMVSELGDWSGARLSETFRRASKNAPAIIFIDEIDTLAPKRDTLGEVERRIVPQLLTLIDDLKYAGQVMVIAATSRPESIDPAVRNLFSFGWQSDLRPPRAKGRLEILRIHTKRMNLANDVDLEKIAAETHGFVGSDISALCSEAALQPIRERMLVNYLENELIDTEVSMENFSRAIDKVKKMMKR